MQQDPETLSLEQVLRILRRRAPWIALCIVVIAGGAYGFSRQQTKKYTATASVGFTNNSLSQQIAGLSGGGASGPLVALQESNVELVRLGDTAARTARALGHGLTEGKVLEDVSVASQGESTVVGVSATTSDATLAAQIANTYVREFVAEQQRKNHAYFGAALAIVRKQLAELTPAQRLGAGGADLQSRAHTLTLLSDLHYGNVQVAQEAPAPTSPSSPKLTRNVLIGALIGLLLGLGLAFLLEHFDRRIHEAGDFESLYGLPALGVVPERAVRRRFGRGGKRVLTDPAEVEAFGLIRAHLRFFNADRDVRSVVIASPVQDDGKSTIARHLAASAASSGSRVLLVEVDLRRPTLAQQLGVEPRPGLTDVLLGATSLEIAAQHAAAEDSKSGPATFDVLTAGSGPGPNPAALIESGAMHELLAHARSIYDFVVIDTPPLVSVSDAFSLLTRVDGVLVVGWVGHSRRDDLERLRGVLARTHAPALGVIVIDAKPDGATGAYASAPGSPASQQTVSTNGHAPQGELMPTSKI